MSITAVTQIKTPAQHALDLIQRHYPNYHPLIALARMAHDEKVTCEPKLEFEIHKAILPYVTPKLSSVEVKAEVKEERRVIVSLFEDAVLEDGRIVKTEVPLVTEVEELVPLDS